MQINNRGLRPAVDANRDIEDRKADVVAMSRDKSPMIVPDLEALLADPVVRNQALIELRKFDTSAATEAMTRAGLRMIAAKHSGKLTPSDEAFLTKLAAACGLRVPTGSAALTVVRPAEVAVKRHSADQMEKTPPPPPPPAPRVQVARAKPPARVTSTTNVNRCRVPMAKLQEWTALAETATRDVNYYRLNGKVRVFGLASGAARAIQEISAGEELVFVRFNEPHEKGFLIQTEVWDAGGGNRRMGRPLLGMGINSQKGVFEGFIPLANGTNLAGVPYAGMGTWTPRLFGYGDDETRSIKNFIDTICQMAAEAERLNGAPFFDVHEKPVPNVGGLLAQHWANLPVAPRWDGSNWHHGPTITNTRPQGRNDVLP